MCVEEWKPIIGYEGLYEISNLGNVRSMERRVNVAHKGFKGTRLLKSKIMKPYNYFGYFGVALCKNKKYKQLLIHRLVAQAFIPNPDNLPCVNHIDENKQNNCVENLEWCTYAYNDNYGNRNKKISESRKGMKFSEEHLKNMSIAGKRRVTPEFKEKMRKVHLGTKLTEEHKRKISEGVRRSRVI